MLKDNKPKESPAMQGSALETLYRKVLIENISLKSQIANQRYLQRDEVEKILMKYVYSVAYVGDKNSTGGLAELRSGALPKQVAISIAKDLTELAIPKDRIIEVLKKYAYKFNLKSTSRLNVSVGQTISDIDIEQIADEILNTKTIQKDV